MKRHSHLSQSLSHSHMWNGMVFTSFSKFISSIHVEWNGIHTSLKDYLIHTCGMEWYSHISQSLSHSYMWNGMVFTHVSMFISFTHVGWNGIQTSLKVYLIHTCILEWYSHLSESISHSHMWNGIVFIPISKLISFTHVDWNDIHTYLKVYLMHKYALNCIHTSIHIYPMYTWKKLSG